MRKQINKDIKASGFVPEFYFFKSSKKFQLDQLETFVDFGSICWYRKLHEQGLEGVDPTHDSRLIQFVLSIPSSEFNKKGIPKLLYKNMMVNLLESEILYNPYSMSQSSDFKDRLANNIFFRDFLKGLDREFSEICNTPNNLLINDFDELCSSQNRSTNAKEIHSLLKNSSLIFWLLKNKLTIFTDTDNIKFYGK